MSRQLLEELPRYKDHTLLQKTSITMFLDELMNVTKSGPYKSFEMQKNKL